jgi:hypothetical protein
MTDIKKGDTVRVQYEGCVTGLHSADKDVLQVTTSTGRIFYATVSAATKVFPPIPTTDGSVIAVCSSVYQLADDQWYVIGSKATISEDAMQAHASSWGFTILSEGFPL